MTKLKDVLHLYLGCECRGFEGTMTYKLVSINRYGKCLLEDDRGYSVDLGGKFHVVLRKLSSMTDEDKKEYKSVIKDSATNNILPIISVGPLVNEFHSVRSVNATIWLLHKGFDLFNLIENKQAIEKA